MPPEGGVFHWLDSLMPTTATVVCLNPILNDEIQLNPEPVGSCWWAYYFTYLQTNYLVVLTSYVSVIYLDRLILIGKLEGVYCSCAFSPKKLTSELTSVCIVSNTDLKIRTTETWFS